MSPIIDFYIKAAVPWKLLTLEGCEVIFATEKGKKGEADKMLINPPSNYVPSHLTADQEPKQFYLELENDQNFCNPISWSDINPTDYDGTLPIILCNLKIIYNNIQ